MKRPRLNKRQAAGRFKGPGPEDPFASQLFTVGGWSAVKEYMRWRPESIERIFCKPKMFEEVQWSVQAFGLSLRVEEETAGKETEREPVRAFVRLSVKDWSDRSEAWREEARPRVLVALDHITDPRNLGAALRNAGFFGVPAVIAPLRRQVLMTQAAVDTAQGGFATTDLVGCVNLARSLSELKERGYWIIGADMEGEDFRQLPGFYDHVCLVFGSEGQGLSRGIRSVCDRLAAIPPVSGGLESLNVAVSIGVFLDRFCRQRSG